jgi:hypothetical protein
VNKFGRNLLKYVRTVQGSQGCAEEVPTRDVVRERQKTAKNEMVGCAARPWL